MHVLRYSFKREMKWKGWSIEVDRTRKQEGWEGGGQFDTRGPIVWHLVARPGPARPGANVSIIIMFRFKRAISEHIWKFALMKYRTNAQMWLCILLVVAVAAVVRQNCKITLLSVVSLILLIISNKWGHFLVVLAKEAMGVVVRERENDFRLLEEMVEHSLFALLHPSSLFHENTFIWETISPFIKSNWFFHRSKSSILSLKLIRCSRSN